MLSEVGEPLGQGDKVKEKNIWARDYLFRGFPRTMGKQWLVEFFSFITVYPNYPNPSIK